MLAVRCVVNRIAWVFVHFHLVLEASLASLLRLLRRLGWCDVHPMPPEPSRGKSPSRRVVVGTRRQDLAFVGRQFLRPGLADTGAASPRSTFEHAGRDATVPPARPRAHQPPPPPAPRQRRRTQAPESAAGRRTVLWAFALGTSLPLVSSFDRPGKDWPDDGRRPTKCRQSSHEEGRLAVVLPWTLGTRSPLASTASPAGKVRPTPGLPRHASPPSRHT